MDVIFRKYKDTKGIYALFSQTIFALFPHDVCNNQGHVTSYQHVGQHSSADYIHCLKISTRATESEAKDLKKELEGIGYTNLNVVTRRNYDRWLQSYRNLN